MARILIIDDDDQLRAILCEMLERSGYETMEACDGKQGVEFYRRDPADLVITDLVMPVKDGIETIQELKQDFPNTKIIAISGGGRIGAEDHLRLAKNCGAQLTLIKPFKLSVLVKAVADLLEGTS